MYRKRRRRGSQLRQSMNVVTPNSNVQSFCSRHRPSCSRKLCCIYAAIALTTSIIIFGLSIASVDINKYNFGLYFALVATVALILSISICLTSPDLHAGAHSGRQGGGGTTLVPNQFQQKMTIGGRRGRRNTGSTAPHNSPTDDEPATPQPYISRMVLNFNKNDSHDHSPSPTCSKSAQYQTFDNKEIVQSSISTHLLATTGDDGTIGQDSQYQALPSLESSSKQPEITSVQSSSASYSGSNRQDPFCSALAPSWTNSTSIHRPTSLYSTLQAPPRTPPSTAPTSPQTPTQPRSPNGSYFPINWTPVSAQPIQSGSPPFLSTPARNDEITYTMPTVYTSVLVHAASSAAQSNCLSPKEDNNNYPNNNNSFTTVSNTKHS